MNRDLLLVGAGLAAGALAVRLLSEPSTCCSRVANGVRDRATSALGAWAGPLGDLFGVWRVSPGLLDLLGVP